MEHFRILPSDIKLDILSRLPTESVLECKLVSKPWRNLISHSSFSQLHLNHLLNNDSGKSIDVLFNGWKDTSQECYYLKYNDENLFGTTSIAKINLTPELSSYSIVGSCNGLICLNQEDWIVICNPITKEYLSLPRLETYTSTKRDVLTGFGYYPVTKEYKVVRVYLANSAEIEVYTLGSGSGWRNLGKLDYQSGTFYSLLGVFANGALYWMHPGKRTIVAFDLDVEKFRDIPLPPILRPSITSTRSLFVFQLGVLGEYLMCAHLVNVDGTVDVWLLKKKNGQGEVDNKSMIWSKEFSFVCKIPFAFTRSGSVLCYDTFAENPIFHCYDVSSSSLERLMSFDKIIRRSPSAHMNTLVSLKALGEENTKIMESSLVTKSNVSGRKTAVRRKCS